MSKIRTIKEAGEYWGEMIKDNVDSYRGALQDKVILKSESSKATKDLVSMKQYVDALGVGAMESTSDITAEALNSFAIDANEVVEELDKRVESLEYDYVSGVKLKCGDISIEIPRDTMDVAIIAGTALLIAGIVKFFKR